MHFAFLGTSGAIPSVERDTTSLVFVGQGESVLVDCGGSRSKSSCPYPL